MCFYFVYKFETFLILGRTERDIVNVHIDHYMKYPLFLSDFN
jgi:hypothetical protein